jgi:hypothetical protein
LLTPNHVIMSEVLSNICLLQAVKLGYTLQETTGIVTWSNCVRHACDFCSKCRREEAANNAEPRVPKAWPTELTQRHADHQHMHAGDQALYTTKHWLLNPANAVEKHTRVALKQQRARPQQQAVEADNRSWRCQSKK